MALCDILYIFDGVIFLFRIPINVGFQRSILNLNLKRIFGGLIFVILIFASTQGGIASYNQDQASSLLPGDTIFYKITNWEVPSLLGIPIDENSTLNANLDLEDSIIALKILRIDESGYYLGAYGTVKRLGSISFSSDGDGLLNLPIPVGLSGPLLPQSYFYFSPWEQGNISLPLWMKSSSLTSFSSASGDGSKGMCGSMKCR